MSRLLSGLYKSHMKLFCRKTKSQTIYSFLNMAGLSIGMTCFIILALWVRQEQSYDRFFQNKERIFRIVAIDDYGNTSSSTPWPLGPSLMENSSDIEYCCRVRAKNASLVQAGDLRFHEQNYYLADPSFFQIFTFTFLAGDPETALNELDAIVITEETATRYFGDKNPMGKRLHILQFNADFKVTGIIQNIPRNSHLQFDLISRLEWMGQERLDSWEPSGFTYALLQPNSNAREVNSQIEAVFAESGDSKFSQIPILQPLSRVHRFESGETGTGRKVYLFSVLAIFVLALACINFTNLSTACAIKTAKEVGIRKVVGATRKQIVIQYMGESIILSFMALLSALALVFVSLPAVNRFLGTELNFIDMVQALFFLILLGLALLTGVLAGCYPAVFLSSFRPTQVLKGKFNLSLKGTPVRKILILFQFSVAVGFIICSLVVYKQLSMIKEKELGFKRDSVVTFSNNPNLTGQFSKFKQKLLEDPGILSVTAASSRPILVRDEVRIGLEGDPGDRSITSAYSMVDFDFFKTFDMEIIQGRGFSGEFPRDRTNTCVINESAARELGLTFPLGCKIYFDHPDFAESYKELEIVGVVRDFHFRSMHQAIGPFVFRFYRPWHFRVFVKIKPGNIQEKLEKIESVFTQYAPRHPFQFEFLEDAFQEIYQSEIQQGYVFSFFGVLAICISCLGLFGLASFTAEQKTKEIGIRKVFGATVPAIVISLSKEFAQSVVYANLVTWPVAYLIMNRWLQNFAYRIDIGLDVFVFTAFFTLGTALLTVAFRTFQAATANPIQPLRHD